MLFLLLRSPLVLSATYPLPCVADGCCATSFLTRCLTRCLTCRLLQVEEGGIITLNKFLENKQGKLVAKDAEKYIDSRAHPEGKRSAAWLKECNRPMFATADAQHRMTLISCCCWHCPPCPAGLLHDRPIVIVPENYIRNWAVTRFWCAVCRPLQLALLLLPSLVL